MKVLIISGFLGAGKTTFIKEMIEKTKKQFAIMENEYGEVGIDGKLLEDVNTDKQINIYELTEGCICCSIKADFSNSVLTIANAIDPQYLIVEPTGVGKLSAIIENIKKITYEKIQLLKPITIVDVNNIQNNIKKYPDIYINQIENSSNIILSKCEGKSQEELEQIKQELLKISKDAKIQTTHYKNFDKSYFNDILSDYLIKPSTIENNDYNETSLDNIGIQDIYLDNENKLIPFLNGIVSGVFGDIVRAKGYLKCGKSYLKFDVVSDRYYIEGIESIDDSRAVFIGKNIKVKWIMDYLVKKESKILKPLL